MRIFKENNKKDKLKNKQVKQLNKIARFNKERTSLEEIKNWCLKSLKNENKISNFGTQIIKRT